MKRSEALYLSAREASAELSISPATLYAYVSRGLIRSEPSPDSRSHRYRAEDVRGLKERRVPAPEPRGLRAFDADLPVLDSAIGTITEQGAIYRGVNCVDLSEKDTLEHTATLLWDVTSVDPFAADNCPSVSDAMRTIAEAARRAAPIDRAIAVLALAASARPAPCPKCAGSTNSQSISTPFGSSAHGHRHANPARMPSTSATKYGCSSMACGVMARWACRSVSAMNAASYPHAAFERTSKAASSPASSGSAARIISVMVRCPSAGSARAGATVGPAAGDGPLPGDDGWTAWQRAWLQAAQRSPAEAAKRQPERNAGCRGRSARRR